MVYSTRLQRALREAILGMMSLEVATISSALKLAAERWGNAACFWKSIKGERSVKFEAGPRALVLAAIERAAMAQRAPRK